MPPEAPTLPRLEYRLARLKLSLRFTYAFHAREIRFERDTGAGFGRVFPETFSFLADRHDPAELYLQIEDLWSKPKLISPEATRREAEDVMMRLIFATPRYLDELLDRLEGDGRLDSAQIQRVYEDAVMLTRVLSRFMRDKNLEREPRLRFTRVHLRKVLLRSLLALLGSRVSDGYLERFARGQVDPIDRGDDLSESGFFYTMARGDVDAVDRCLVATTERVYFQWIEEICLDEENQAFEAEESPFADREWEVLRALHARGGQYIARGRDISPFLRRPNNKNCLRILEKLERWFFRQYDVHHAAVVIRHAAHLRHGIEDAERILSRHSASNYAKLLLLVALPYLGAIFFYERAPDVFDWICSAEVVVILAGTFWFFLYNFCWKRDLTVFYTAVPRVMAGIIVGYAPVFLIDEVWDLAGSSWFPLISVGALLGFTTLLYLYVEIRRRIPDSSEAFSRARSIFLLGIVEAFGFGIVTTSLLGPFMVARNWVDVALPLDATTVDALQAAATPVLGELPRVLGVDPFFAFPTAVFLFTFLSFFIGTFLQLLWEDLPFTEPL